MTGGGSNTNSECRSWIIDVTVSPFANCTHKLYTSRPVTHPNAMATTNQKTRSIFGTGLLHRFKPNTLVSSAKDSIMRINCDVITVMAGLRQTDDLRLYSVTLQGAR